MSSIATFPFGVHHLNAAIEKSRETENDPATTHQRFNAIMKTLPVDAQRELREVVRLYGKT